MIRWAELITTSLTRGGGNSGVEASITSLDLSQVSFLLLMYCHFSQHFIYSFSRGPIYKFYDDLFYLYEVHAVN